MIIIMEEYKLAQEFLNKQNKKKKLENNFTKKYLISLLNRTLLSFLLLAICLCITKIDKKSKSFLEENIYNKNISFSKINNLYEKYFGKVAILDEIEKKTTVKIEPVFSEKLSYTDKSDYKEGVKLVVEDNYLVPIVESGIVVYIGDKDNYGYTVIIQQVNGVDLWYVGVKNVNLKLYEYVEKGKLLGEVTDNNLYLYYQKDGKFVSYKDYLE